jgi:hypothetical protein
MEPSRRDAPSARPEVPAMTTTKTDADTSANSNAGRRFERILLVVIAACLVVNTVDRLTEDAHAYDGATQRVLIVGADSRISLPVHASGLVPTRGESALAVRVVGGGADAANWAPGQPGTMGRRGNVGPDWAGSDYGARQSGAAPAP